METYAFLNEDGELIAGVKANRMKVAAGVGVGFNSHAGTGTIASAKEQQDSRNRGEGAFISALLSDADTDAVAVRNALVIATVTHALKLSGFDATWSVTTKSGVEMLDVSNCADMLAAYGSTLAVEITTDNAPEDTVDAHQRVRATIGKALGALDKSGRTYSGYGRDLLKLIATSEVVNLAIGEQGSALTKLVEAAQAAIDAAKSAPKGIFGINTADLAHCPSCGTSTTRTDLVCSNGHQSTAAVRAAQEVEFLALATEACTAAGLSLAVSVKRKGSPREALVDATVESLASVQEFFATVSADATDPWTRLSTTSVVMSHVDAGIIARTGTTDVKSRVIRVIRDAIEKAANDAADEIAAPVALEIARFVVAVESERRDAALAKVFAEYEADLRARANRASAKQIKQFVEDTNRHRRFVAPKGQNQKGSKRNARGGNGARKGRKSRR